MNGTIYKNNVNYGANISDSQPVGQIIESASEKTPAGYLPILDVRQSVLRADYPDLFKKIGTTYGAVDDAHFNLPCEDDVVPEKSNGLFKTYEYTLTLSSAQSQVWTTIVDPDKLPNGFYAFDIQIDDRYYWWYEHLSFTMFYYGHPTNDSNASTIYFNQSGHATNGNSVSLRFVRSLTTNGGDGFIQINCRCKDNFKITVKAFKID